MFKFLKKSELLTAPSEQMVTDHFVPPELLRTAVLFIVFNRPDTTEKVFETIRKAKPPRLYVAADGPREGRVGEPEAVDAVRKIATNVDWPCDVKTLFREKNLGCKYAVSGAISWFFNNEEQGIILEDDCLPSQSFFWFCQQLLERYRFDTRIWQISGTIFFPKGVTVTNSDYLYSKYGSIWGWASWRRAWQNYDVELGLWKEMSDPGVIANVYPNIDECKARLKIGNQLVNNKIDTWDYQWSFCKNFNGGLSVVPKNNIVVNIGFNEDATHTKETSIHNPTFFYEINADLRHPVFVVEDIKYQVHFSKAIYSSSALRKFYRRCRRLAYFIRC